MVTTTDGSAGNGTGEQATVELLGALAYGKLRAVEAAARLIGVAPDAHNADLAVAVVEHELAAYRALHDDLITRTDAPAAVMDAQKEPFDAYFDRAPLDDWFGASVFFALGLPIAADFARALAPVLDDRTAALVTEAIGGREEFEAAAVERRVEATIRRRGRAQPKAKRERAEALVAQAPRSGGERVTSRAAAGAGHVEPKLKLIGLYC
jgi:hypothetical protein